MSATEADRVATREAVLKAYNQCTDTNHNTNCDRNTTNTTNTNGDHYQNGSSSDEIHHKDFPMVPKRPLSALLSSFEVLAVSVYKCLHIGLHTSLAIAFLALIAVQCLGNFHDRYFVTILNRARRTDSDLKGEITYYNRRCTYSDVTTSKYHHIHLGVEADSEHDDKASEIFIDPRRFVFDDDDDDELEHAEQDFGLDENGIKVRYQTKPPKRRRRRLATAHDVWEKPILRPIPKKVAKRAGRQAVRSMMTHGSVMVPQILSDATIEELRDFIVEKNERVQGTSDQYPMSQAHHRISYGIESTEHPAVVRALREIQEHRVFAELIQNLVGDDNPALSEITAITAWAGAESQSWHPDVKPDGNGVMFGRTYSHSYSLFLPLQDTVGSMGPTDLCPGTHMCADEDLWDMCEANKIGLHEIRRARPRHEYDPGEKGTLEYLEDVSKEGTWRAGDGALLNQQVWHKGGEHSDENKADRVVFIVSFLKSPRADDPRQLARGTYFHQKWLNWGSTWQDMADAAYSLKRPWNILRCLHLYKPRDRSWGYDLFTATTLRVANGQMGGQPEDLENLIENVMVPLNYPEWLQGTADYESDDAWQIYLWETIRKTHSFLLDVNAFGLIGYALFVGIAATLAYVYHEVLRKQTHDQKTQFFVPVLKTSVRRLCLSHGSIIALGWYFWNVTIRSSQWAIDIDSGTTLMRPFPQDPIFRDEDPGVQGGKTTLPKRADVLIGTRFHTKAIGAYHTWLDYHPGNRVLNHFVDSYGGNGKFYHSLLGGKRENYTASLLPATLTNQLALSAFDMIQKRHGGRFVMQDYRSGYWKILSDAECMEYIHSRLYIGSENTLLGAVKEEVDLMLNRYRFGVQRKTLSMAWNSQLFVADLSKKLFVPESRKDTKKRSKDTMVRDGSLSLSLLPSLSFFSRFNYRLPEWKSVPTSATNSLDESGVRRFLMGSSRPSLFLGMDIILNSDDGPIGATVTGISRKTTHDGRARYQLAFNGEDIPEIGVVGLTQIKRESIVPREPVSEGSRVLVRLDEEEGEESYEGTVLLVLADGSVDVLFDEDGEIGRNIPYVQYDLLME